MAVQVLSRNTQFSERIEMLATEDLFNNKSA